MENVEEYIDLVTDFCFNSGIRCQMEAFRGKLDSSDVHVWKRNCTKAMST